MRRNGLLVTAFVLALAVGLPAAAQDSAWSVGLGFSAGEASPDSAVDLDLEAFTILGRWQHKEKG